MKERINLFFIIIALWAFLFIFQNYMSTFWAISFLVFFMFMYGIYMQIAYKHRKRKQKKNPQHINPHYKPFMSILIPAHNEETVIGKTVENILKLDYPSFEIIVIDDRSSDKTAEKIINLQNENEKVIAFIRDKDAFSGKSAVLNDAMK